MHQLHPGRRGDLTGAIIVVFALLALALAAVGYDKIHLAQRGFAYLMIVILTVFSVAGLMLLQVPGRAVGPAGFRGVPFLAQLFAAASYQLSWSIYVSDYSRYLPRDVGVRESFWWTYLGAFIGGAWMMLVGTVAAAAGAEARRVPPPWSTPPTACMPGFGKVLLVGGAARPGHRLDAQFLRRIAHAAERRRHPEAAQEHAPASAW